MALAIGAGIFMAMTATRARAACALKVMVSPGAVAAMSSRITSRPPLAVARRYASVVTQKPVGTGKPARVISPRLPAFPPTSPSMPP